MVMKFDKERFALFFSNVPIPAKEGGGEGTGVGRRLELLPTQVYVLKEFAEGLEKGEHIFWILKARQNGITTESLLLIAMWAMINPGMIFAHIAPDTKLVEVNRALLAGMLNGLPGSWKLPTISNNRVMMEFSNGSRIIWLNANASKGKSSGLGQGIGMLGLHGTEIGSWTDEDGIKSLMSSLAQKNPARLYIFEGTSKGAGIFKEYWEEAAQGGATGRSAARALFVSWWLNPFYQFNLADNADLRLHKLYWNGVLTREEAGRVEEVRQRYGYEFREEQLSWWRYMLCEPFKNRAEMLLQEYPWLAEDAWTYGAKSFIKPVSVQIALKRAKVRQRERKTAPQAFRYVIGNSFEESQFEPVAFADGHYDLVIFEGPAPARIDKRFERLVVSCDPTHGANAASDLGVLQVWRAHTDKLVLLAEYTRRDAPAYHLAWVLLELAGLYDAQAKVILELMGGGHAMHDTLELLNNQIQTGFNPGLVKYFERLDFYRYSRLDSAGRTKSQTYHWITSGKTKEYMLNRLRDFFEQDKLIIHSLALLREIEGTTLDREGEVRPAHEDNRLMAAAIGVVGWLQVIKEDIRDDERYSYASWLGALGQVVKAEGIEELDPAAQALSERVANWKSSLKSAIKKAGERERLINSGEWDNYVDDWEEGVEQAEWPEEDQYGA